MNLSYVNLTLPERSGDSSQLIGEKSAVSAIPLNEMTRVVGFLDNERHPLKLKEFFDCGNYQFH
jgi:hypothetical protein